MRISYALLLCIPIGFVFFLIARFCSRCLMGHYEQPERRVALIFGFFGALLIPIIWASGCLEEEFPTLPAVAITNLFFLAEVLVMSVLIRRSYMRSRDEESKQTERF